MKILNNCKIKVALKININITIVRYEDVVS